MSCIINFLKGGAILYVAPVGTAFPAKELAAGADPGGVWRNVGSLGAPVAFSQAITKSKIEEQNNMRGLGETTDTIEETFTTALKNYSAANLALALNGTASSVAAGSGTVGYDKVAANDSSITTYYAVLIEGKDINGLPARFELKRTSFKSAGDVAAFDDAGDTTMAAIVGSVWDDCSGEPYDFYNVTAVALP